MLFISFSAVNALGFEASIQLYCPDCQEKLNISPEIIQQAEECLADLKDLRFPQIPFYGKWVNTPEGGVMIKLNDELSVLEITPNGYVDVVYYNGAEINIGWWTDTRFEPEKY